MGLPLDGLKILLGAIITIWLPSVPRQTKAHEPPFGHHRNQRCKRINQWMHTNSLTLDQYGLKGLNGKSVR